MDNIYIDTGQKNIKNRVLKDGVYTISLKKNPNRVLTISNQKYYYENNLLNEPLTKHANQFFFIKYNDDSDDYIISSLHSHQLLGVEKGLKYNLSYIGQFPDKENILFHWKIMQDDNYFSLELKGTGLNLEYIKMNSKKLLLLCDPNNENKYQHFVFKSIDILQSGYYYINSKSYPRCYLTFQGKSDDIVASRLSNQFNQVFLLQFDSNDGCYSIVNISNSKCIESSSELITQNNIFGFDSQKWIIGTYDMINDGYFIESKSDFSRITINKLSWKYHLEDFQLTSLQNKHQFFNFKPCDIDTSSFNEEKSLINKRLLMPYSTRIDLSDQENNYNIEELWSILNICHDLEKLTIPLSINDIPKNAFINCKKIKKITCDPKWLPFLPNPLNVENIEVLNGISNTEISYFKNFINLKALVLPEEFKIEDCPKNIFEDISDLKYFKGDPAFMKLLHKQSLEHVVIPSYAKEIPEGAFSGCNFLYSIQFENNSQLKTIKSNAFADCQSLTKIVFPESIDDISPYAFINCNENIELIFHNERQKCSMYECLIIESNETNLSNYYETFCNISVLEMPLSVVECKEEVLKGFKYLSSIKCDPKWLNCCNTDQIRSVFIQDGIKKIYKKDFEKLIHLNILSIPNSVESFDDDDPFSNCHELTVIICSSYHLKYINETKITSITINNNVSKIDGNSFSKFVNLEYVYLPDSIEFISPFAFINCKKLLQVECPISAERYIHNRAEIDETQTKIIKQDFNEWYNLKYLEIPQSVEEIEDETFDNCLNIQYLNCHPKWFSYIPKSLITAITIPDFVKELKSGIFDEFIQLSSIVLPPKININDPNIFDNNENLSEIICDDSLFNTLSKKTRIRCKKNQTCQYEISNVQPDSRRIHDELHKINCDEFIPSYTTPKETTIDDLMKIDSNKYGLYREYIENVIKYTENCTFPKTYKPKNSSLDEISIVCGIVCHHIKKKITLRPVQILSILCLLNEILNDDESHGSIGEIKTGEGKSIIITILAIILVKYNHSVDIVTTNMELAKRDQKNHYEYFQLFGINTGVLCHKIDDIQFMKTYINQHQFSSNSGFNDDVFNNPVVYSTNANFEFYYLHSISSIEQPNQKFDIVLIDEVDSMFIDELNEPAIVSEKIQYGHFKEILLYVFLNQNESTSNILKTIKKETENTEIKEKDIELLKKAAMKACKLKPKIDYLVVDNEIILIDHSTHFQKKGARFSKYVHEMIEIKHGLRIHDASHAHSQITQYAYFRLYNKIIGVTGTIGDDGDETYLKNAYNINIFKFPRHYESQLNIYLKKRPNNISDIFDMVSQEIEFENKKGRPVIIIWNSIKCAEDFENKRKNYPNDRKITAEDVISDRDSIKLAGNPKSVTNATLVVGRGIDIKIPDESLKIGGLHVIIPMCMRNQRSLVQAVGRAGRQGQPGSVSIYISDDDKYEKNTQIQERDENLLKIQINFWNYLKEKYKWLFIPMKNDFPKNPILPFGGDYSIIMKILFSYAMSYIGKNPFINKQIPTKGKEIKELFINLCMRTIKIAWGAFFNNLYDNDENVDKPAFCEKEYDAFIKKLNYWLPLIDENKDDSINKVMMNLNSRLMISEDRDYSIIAGIRITAFCITVDIPADNFGHKIVSILVSVLNIIDKNAKKRKNFLAKACLVFF